MADFKGVVPLMLHVNLWVWLGFIVCILLFLALDLGVLNRRARVIGFAEAIAWSAGWFLLALA
ncbi:MAG: hypothetical protein ACREFR_12675, partial [Limisphaerales bacterium]